MKLQNTVKVEKNPLICLRFIVDFQNFAASEQFPKLFHSLEKKGNKKIRERE